MRRFHGGWRLDHMSSCLLLENHKLLLSSQTPCKKPSVPKTYGYLEQHARYATERGKDPKMLGQRVYRLAVVGYPRVLAVTGREAQILDLNVGQLPAGPDDSMILNLSQDAGMAMMKHKLISPCVTPKGRAFHTGRMRFLLGIELLAFQSVYYPEAQVPLLEEYDSAFLAHLAGNSFEGRCCAVSWLTLFATVSACHSGPPPTWL